MIEILKFFGTLWGRIGLGVGIVGSLVALRAIDVSRHEQRGAAKAVAKIEKANDNAAKAGKRAAERSADVRVRGPIDPSTRD